MIFSRFQRELNILDQTITLCNILVDFETYSESCTDQQNVEVQKADATLHSLIKQYVLHQTQSIGWSYALGLVFIIHVRV